MGRLLRSLGHALSLLIPHRADWRAMGWRGVGGALLSAALMTLAFPRADLGWLAWVGLVPILLATEGREARAAKWLWYLFGALWLYASLCWFNVTAYVNPLVVAGIVLMALILALFILLFGWAAWWFRRLGTAPALVLIPMMWSAVEMLRTIGELAFPWLFLAHTQYRHPLLIQSASIFGTHALSFLIVAANTLVAEAVWRWRTGLGARERRTLLAAAAVWLALMGLNFWGGARALTRWHRPPGANAIRVAILQPDWPQPQKIEALEDEDEASDLFRDLLTMLNRLRPDTVDLVLMPESVVLDYVFPLEGREHFDALAAEAQRLHATLVFGANNAEIPPGLPQGASVRYSDLLIHNSIWAIGPDGEFAGVYNKINLVPFAESAPLITLIPGLMRLTLGPILLFEPGQTANPLPVTPSNGGRPIPLGSFVCFESTFPNTVRRFVANGAEVLATVTNDGWFLNSAGPRQHWMAQPFRAVENRRWLIRSANTGISGIVDPAGAVIERTQVGERRILEGSVAPETAITVYTRHGDWPARCFLVICALALAAARFWHRPIASEKEESP
jgi:apolipoprotein N-acyltransferase